MATIIVHKLVSTVKNKSKLTLKGVKNKYKLTLKGVKNKCKSLKVTAELPPLFDVNLHLLFY